MPEGKTRTAASLDLGIDGRDPIEVDLDDPYRRKISRFG
jgi:hypothetical protein